jgi:NNP family nitrate/nitrite transporter-like MFS transporter
MNSGSDRSNTVQLILGTGAFALCFAVFGSVSAMMPVLKRQFHLAPVQASISMAIPVLLGSLAESRWDCWRTGSVDARSLASPW